MTNVNNSLQFYIKICEENLPDRATQKDIRKYLDTNFPNIFFSKNTIEFIRTELRKMRNKLFKKTTKEFRNQYDDNYTREDIKDFFEKAELTPSDNEIRTLLKMRAKNVRFFPRLKGSDAKFLEEVAKRTNIDRNIILRHAINLGLDDMNKDLYFRLLTTNAIDLYATSPFRNMVSNILKKIQVKE